MNIFGIGPMLAFTGAIGLLIILVLHLGLGVSIPLSPPWYQVIRVLGAFLCIIGVYFWISSILLISRAYKSHHLETSGVYRFSRNPMYAAFIVFLVPGIACICNNLLILIVPMGMYVAFKIRIKREEEYLEQSYGVEYQQYERKVAQLVPFVRL